MRREKTEKIEGGKRRRDEKRRKGKELERREKKI